LRRTKEVLKTITELKGSSCGSILDVGTADCMMLTLLQRNIDMEEPVGMDLSVELLKENTNASISLVQGDALFLPFRGCWFDVVVGAALIEHVPDPVMMIAEFRRILKPGGICIVTTPSPVFESIANRVCHLQSDKHTRTYDLPELRDLFTAAGLNIVAAHRFMLSPIGLIPLEDRVEQVIRAMWLSFLLCNQIIVSRK